VRDDAQAPGRRIEEPLDRPLPFLDGEEDALPGRTEGEEAVEAGTRVEVGERGERVLVERLAAVPERRDRGGEGTGEVQQVKVPEIGLPSNVFVVKTPLLRPPLSVVTIRSPRVR
jgi:hypothetical protein